MGRIVCRKAFSTVGCHRKHSLPRAVRYIVSLHMYIREHADAESEEESKRSASSNPSIRRIGNSYIGKKAAATQGRLIVEQAYANSSS